MGRMRAGVCVAAVVLAVGAVHAATQTGDRPARWSEAKAQQWYAAQPWLVGANFLPSDAINQLEMWQAESFDPAEIDRELGWAEGLGMNTMRVFLHDQLWQQDAPGFQKRIDTFLTIAAKHHIKPIFVLFDSCWDPEFKLGPQRPPIPGVHNSGWVQSPGAKALEDAAEYPRLKTFVEGVIGAFANDDRILAWDLWNEPDNEGGGDYAKLEPKNKEALVAKLLPQVFAWARAAHPTQPLTSPLWHGGRWDEADGSECGGAHAGGRIGCDQLSQLRLAGGFCEPSASTGGVPPAIDLHRVHGTADGLDLRYDSAAGQATARRDDQLGICAGQVADVDSVG